MAISIRRPLQKVAYAKCDRNWQTRKSASPTGALFEKRLCNVTFSKWLSLARRRDEAQRHAVVAPALPRGRRSVVEHMTLMASAAHTVILGARHDHQEILLGGEAAGNACEEARPTGAA